MLNEKPTLFAVLAECSYAMAILLTMAALCITLFWLFAPTRSEQYWYSFTKGVPTSRVFVSKRPMDCYFDQAPIGKRCHYEKEVDVGKDLSGNTRVTVSWHKVSE